MKMRMKTRMNKSEKMKKQLEEDFLRLVESGEDFRFYLYFSPDMLTSRVRDYLDDFLLEEAYQNIASGKASPQDFIVYDDHVMTVRLKEWEKKVEVINKMLSHFESKEEYEKCKVIQEFFLVLEGYQF
jgi:hypothetical protein